MTGGKEERGKDKKKEMEIQNMEKQRNETQAKIQSNLLLVPATAGSKIGSVTPATLSFLANSLT